MKNKDVDRITRALPGVTMQVQWGDNRVYKVGGKIFVISQVGKPNAAATLSFKCSELAFEMLIERYGIIPAPYLARAKWVAIEEPDAMDDDELAARIAEAHRLIAAKLPKKIRAELNLGQQPKPTPKRRAKAER